MKLGFGTRRFRIPAAIGTRSAFWLFAACCFGAVLDAQARSVDFIDETLVSKPLKLREIGLEMGAEARLDTDYRTQAWYAPEVEFAPFRWWFLESKLQGVERGGGLELGGWVFGTRLRLLDPERAYVDVSAAVEYEVETGAAKHPGYERLVNYRGVITRSLRSLQLTANLGAQQRLSPFPQTDFAWGFGARYPEADVLSAGIELGREPLDRSTRLTPQAWIRLPGDSKLRLGGVFDLDPGPIGYRFVARAILEIEFE